MVQLRMVLLILAVVCFALNAFGVQTIKGNLESAGLALLALSMLIV